MSVVQEKLRCRLTAWQSKGTVKSKILLVHYFGFLNVRPQTLYEVHHRRSKGEPNKTACQIAEQKGQWRHCRKSHRSHKEARDWHMILLKKDLFSFRSLQRVPCFEWTRWFDVLLGATAIKQKSNKHLKKWWNIMTSHVLAPSSDARSPE